jgi:glyoxylase-like metal-dependent hydrolase (beta-lactamase superfamily II)
VDVIAPGISQIDTLLGGMDRMTAGFLVDGAQPALVETGSQTSVAAVRDALTAAGVGAHDLRWIIVTHIHLDHGLYGRMIPVPEARLVAAGDGHRVDLGDGHFLTMVDSPGHAKHHHAVLDEQTGTLLVGDAVGVRLPDFGVLRPATPPPDFDLEQATASLRRFAELRPEMVVLTHYGPVDHPLETLSEAEEMLHQWVEVAERTMRASEEAGIAEVAAALADVFAKAPDGLPEAVRGKFEVLNGVHSNAAGIVRYLSRRSQAVAE